MIHDVDETLTGIVKRDILNGSNVEISFEAPSRDWAARRSGPTLNFYLYDITEDLSRRDISIREIRNEQGRVVDRRVPEKRFRLAYLVTAWTQRAQDEHRLLSSVLSCFLRFDVLPSGMLKGSLVDAAGPLWITVGLPLPKDRQLSDIWSALGGELKPSLDLVVTAPFAVGKVLPVGQLVTVGTVLQIDGVAGQSEKVVHTPLEAAGQVREEDGKQPVILQRLSE